jgi:chromosome segregation ATPase
MQLNDWRPVPFLSSYEDIATADVAATWQAFGSRPNELISTLTVSRKQSRAEVEQLESTAAETVQQSISAALERTRTAARDTEAWKRLGRLTKDLASAEADLSAARSQASKYQRAFAAAVARGAGEDAEASESQETSALDSVNKAARRVDALKPLIPDAREQCRKVLRELAAAELRKLDYDYAQAHAAAVGALVASWQANKQQVAVSAVARAKLHPAEQKNIVETTVHEVTG